MWSLNPLKSGLIGNQKQHMGLNPKMGRLNPLKSGLIGNQLCIKKALQSIVSIPLNRVWLETGYEAGVNVDANGLNPLKSGLIGNG